MGLDPTVAGEAAVDFDDGSGDKGGGVTHQVVEGSEDFIGLAETQHRSVVDDFLPTFGEASILVGQECPVLVGDEEPWGNGIDSDTGTVALGHFGCHPAGEVVDAGFGVGIAEHPGDGLFGGHRGEIENRSLPFFRDGFAKNEGGDHRALEVEIHDLGVVVELEGIKQILVGTGNGSSHVASGSIDQDVDGAESCDHVIVGSLDLFAVGDITSEACDVFRDGFCFLDRFFNFFGEEAEDGHFGSLFEEVASQSPGKNTGGSGDGDDFVFDIEELVHSLMMSCLPAFMLDEC